MEPNECGVGTNGGKLDPRNSAGGASELFVDLYSRPPERPVPKIKTGIILNAASIVVVPDELPETETLL